MLLYLIRHGNAKKLAGESYVTAPLTELGRAQAELTGDYLRTAAIHWDAYYSSPLRRAVETANIIGAAIEMTPALCPDLREMEYREFPATIVMELVARTGLLNRYLDAHIGKPIRYPMVGRVARVVLDLATRYPQGRVGVVAHGGVISSVMAWYFPRERRRWWRETVGNCSLTALEIEGERATVSVYDQVSHLASLAAEAHRRNYTLTGDEGM